METPSLPAFIILSSATLLEAAKAMGSNSSRTVAVVDDDRTKKVLGVLSEGDILRALLQGTDVHSPVQDIMRVSFQYFQEGQVDMERARKLFLEHGFGLLPIVDAEMRLVSVITMLDCLRSS